MMARRIPRGGSGGFTPPVGSEAVYALFNGTNATGLYRIGAATKSGGTWSKYGSNPVITPGAGGAWDNTHVKDPWLMHDGSQYIAFYSGDNNTTRKLGVATASAHTGAWTKDAGNPILTVGSGGSWDDTDISFATVLNEPGDTGREWKMWYIGSDGSTERIGYAYASAYNGPWTKHSGNPVIDVGAGGTWEDEGVGMGGVINVGGTYYLFYSGRQGTTVPRWQTGIATCTDPEGTYTKDAGNPIILARFNDAGTSLNLTANTTSGSAIVQVSSTAAWNVNEPMAICDGDSDTDIRSIASIDSGTQITLDSGVSSTMTSGGGTIRPFAWNSIVARHVRVAPGGGYEAFCTPFQPVDDLSPGGVKLREGAMRMTAPALAGPWSYDYTTGLMWPPGGSGDWDRYSAENPMPIAAP